MTNYLLFHIAASISILTFMISLLWTFGYIRERVLLRLRELKVRTRNFIDLSMIISRLILPLPIIPQLRFEINLATFTIGFLIFIAGVYFIVSGVHKLYPKLMYGKPIDLVTDGVYSVVRHPIYFGDSVWPLGWSIMFGAICSSLLTPIWLIIYIITTYPEERVLKEMYGDRYEEYKRRVKRIIPYIF